MAGNGREVASSGPGHMEALCPAHLQGAVVSSCAGGLVRVLWSGLVMCGAVSCGHVWCGGGGMACTRVRVCAYLLSRLVTTTWLLEDVPLLRSVTPSIPLYYCRGNMSYFLSNVN